MPEHLVVEWKESRVRSALRILVEVPSVLAEIAAGVLIAGVTIDVAWRLASGGSVPAMFSIVTIYCMPAIFFLPLGKAQALGAHITVEIFAAKLSENLRRAAQLIAAFFSASVLILLFLSAGRVAVSKYRIGLFEIDGNFTIYTWPSMFFLPIGVGVAVLVILFGVFDNRDGELSDE